MFATLTGRLLTFAMLLAVTVGHLTKATAAEVLAASGVQGGLVVHFGCGDGRLTAELWANSRYRVHGLDADAANVAEARQYLRQRNLYGNVLVKQFSGGRLPYADNLVNLLVAEQLPETLTDEVLRVLVPGGVAMVKRDGRWTKTTKPWPPQIDEWTHWLHGPDGNAVARDRVVGPPRRVQWLAGPLRSRHHNTVPSVSAMVSSAGRLFYIVDEAPTAADDTAPDKWALVARDALNGIELWRIPLPEDQWGWKAWSAYSDERFNQPNQIPKRLVAVGQTVYVTLGFNAPVTALDAATGRVVRTYDKTRFTDEILVEDGTLILSVNESAQKAAPIEDHPPVKKSVCAVDAETGKLLWKSERHVGVSTKTDPLERVTHLLLAARGGRVVLVDQESIVALDQASGKELWKSSRPEVQRYTSRYAHLMSEMSTLVATDDVVLFCQLEPIQKRIGWRVIRARLQAYSSKTGKVLWDYVCGNWGHFCVPDVFVTGGLVWVHDKESMGVVGLDLISGEEKKRISTELAFDNGHHHRCYRNKATERFLVTSFRGLEFIDWAADTTQLNHWVRGTCRLGICPSNGLIYSTPDPCDCYIGSKLNGIYALAPQSEEAESGKRKAEFDASNSRLVRGPAYGKTLPPPSAPRSPLSDAWPTYRHDPGRSGHTTSTVPAAVRLLWEADLKGPTTAPVVADGKVFAAGVNTGTVHALDASTGRTLWRYTADGPIDTPPTIYRGLVLFGGRDGHVYCLRASDGTLVWRFRAAPRERLVGALGRFESAWPVHGSVLVQDNAVYAAAGRSSFLDGGIYAYRLDPLSGKVLAEEKHASTHDMQVYWGRNLKVDTGLLADVLVGDGRHVFVRQRQLFDDDSTKETLGYLRSTAGMLDESWFNRTAWMLDERAYGDLLVYDEQTVYAVRKYQAPGAYKQAGAHLFFPPGADGYELAAMQREPVEARRPNELDSKINNRWTAADKKIWSLQVPVRPTSMLLAGETLFAAGTPDVIDPDEPWAAYDGKRGGVLLAISAAEGEVLARYRLDDAPRFDGLAAAGGRLLLATNKGRILCYGDQ